MSMAPFAPGIANRSFRGPAVFAAVLLTVTAASAGDGPSPAIDLYGDPLPAGASVRLGTERLRVTGRKQGLAFAADNRTLVAGVESGDGQIVLFDAPTGKRLQTIDTQGQYLEGMKLLSDRKTLVTVGHQSEDGRASCPSAKIWDVTSGKLKSKILWRDPFMLRTFDVTADAKTIVVAPGGMLQFWDVETHVMRLEVKIDKWAVGKLALSPDGKLAVASFVNALVFCDLAEGDDPVRIREDETTQALAFSPDGSILAEGRYSGTDVLLRDVRSRKVLHTLRNSEKSHMYVNSLAFTSDGRWLAAVSAAGPRGAEGRVLVWDVGTGNLQREILLPMMGLQQVAVSADGQWLAAAGTDCIIKVWNLKTGAPVQNESIGNEESIISIHLTPDGRTAVTGGNDGTLRFWDAGTGKQKRLFRHGYWVRGTALSPDGGLLVSSSLDDSLRVCETSTGNERFRLAGHGEWGGRRAVAFTADGRRIASWGDDLNLRIIDVATGKAISERRTLPAGVELAGGPDEARQAEVRQLATKINQEAFSPDARRFALGIRDSITIFDVDTGKELTRLANPGAFLARLAFSPDGGRLAISAPPIAAPGNNGHAISVIELDSQTELFSVEAPDKNAGPVAYSADGKLLAVMSGNQEMKIRVLDAQTGDERQSFEHVPSSPHALCFSHDGRRLACGFFDGTALIWDLEPSP